MIHINWEILNKTAKIYYSLPIEERATWVEQHYKCLTTIDEQKLFKEELKLLPYCWDVFCRQNQNIYKIAISGGYKTIALIAGRGFGKTLSASKYIRDVIYSRTVDPKHDILIVGPNNDETKKIMYDGDSGLEAIFPTCHRPVYNTQSHRIKFHTGNRAYLRTSEDANSCRGSNTSNLILDEIAAYNPNQLNDLYNNALASLRKPPGHCVITTTPRSFGAYGLFFKQLLEDSLDPENKILIIRGKTVENIENFTDLEDRRRKFEGTSVWQEEYEAEFLFDGMQVLFPEKILNQNCISQLDDKIISVVVSVDPAVTTNEKSDETGLVIVGKIKKANGDIYCAILDDFTDSLTPMQMSTTCVDQFIKYNNKMGIPTLIKYESNQGADYIKNAILEVAKSKNVRVNLESKHSSTGKLDRAFPTSQLVCGNKIKFLNVNNKLHKLIQQCAKFTGFNSRAKSDDRVDAMCQGVNHLMYEQKVAPIRDLTNLPRF